MCDANAGCEIQPLFFPSQSHERQESLPFVFQKRPGWHQIKVVSWEIVVSFAFIEISNRYRGFRIFSCDRVFPGFLIGKQIPSFKAAGLDVYIGNSCGGKNQPQKGFIVFCLCYGRHRCFPVDYNRADYGKLFQITNPIFAELRDSKISRI